MRVLGSILVALIPTISWPAPPALDERPASEQEWGYRPAAGAVLEVTPPAFSWRPQSGIVSWEVECTAVQGAPGAVSRASGILFKVHCPPTAFEPGKYTWRYRGTTKKGESTNWSQSRTFTIDSEAVEMPLPGREELLARIPKSHPRLFVRPEDVPRLEALARGPMAGRFQELVALFRLHRSGQPVPADAKLDRTQGGYVLTAPLSDGSVTALLPVDDSAVVSAAGLSTRGEIVVQRRAGDGSVVQTLTVKQ